MTAPSPWRTWIDIDLDAVVYNYRLACSMTRATVTCVVKSNAYGHGAVQTSLALQRAGCRSFAVACAREALELRQAGITGEILVMGWSEPYLLTRLAAEGVILTVSSAEEWQVAEAAAVEAGRTAALQVKVDTGFHRLGFACNEETARLIAETARRCPHTAATGLFSHLGLITQERDEAQYAALMAMQQWLKAAGLPLTDVHLCDSIGLVRYPAWHLSRVRVGAFLFGMRPSCSEHLPFQQRETLVFRAKVAQVRDVPVGEVVGYDESGETTRPLRVATICAGYGDGYPRSLSGIGQVELHGQRAQVVGLVCMDQLMVDVTAIPEVKAGDTATLLGGGIPCMEMADWARTNRNECLTILSRRPVRVYHQEGEALLVEDNLLG